MMQTNAPETHFEDFGTVRSETTDNLKKPEKLCS